MYTSHAYQSLSEQQIIIQVKKDGFNPVKFHDEAGYVYKPHKHPETKLLVFLQGSMDVTAGNTVYHCKKGDKLIIPGNVIHSAIVGTVGCEFLWSEKML